ncbi:chromate transporter [Jeotgalicoccus coquinae]|uniref:Chromate transport protein n=1 Tax=Jeotgalicoccus coquinae TaxID=709509 RepID=A0A6V7RAZ0_9STAP|nr:chromate transporter [Jeotgalicoccus coquinae]MBB6422756.1 chromate transporter [Jeotgalicoccus coquinae]GGE13356.1 chromate transporter [Jeotgalicoccus coquinae]CAD2074343.1 Chromate transport protein [Jeotgalicoccus coquinae]
MNKIKILIEILLVSTRLGLTSFGGPTAHLGYFHTEYVRRKKWMDEKSYADLVALSQFLPGPASSQVGIGVGVMRGGVLGGLTSFIGFTLPSVIVLMIFASLLTTFDIADAGWIHGLKIVAVVIVAHAIMGMSKNLAPDIRRKVIALLALVGTLLFQSVFTQVGVILIAALIGFILFKDHEDDGKKAAAFPIKKSFSAVCLVLFFVLLFALPAFRELTGSYWVAVVDSFYRAGALVFGGGHVVLPLLEQELVPMGWISAEEFLAGYGATQAVPGPLFTFAAYLGTVMNGWLGGLVATAAIFMPAFLLILGALPFWDMLRNNDKVKGAVMGANAAVIGILISALYTPIWTSSIMKPADFALAAILFVMLVNFKLPPWIIVVTGAVGGMLIGFM